ncbi:hypothetical protein T492DRAFT_958538 [Pavlovales sp. CCMP2436]|nr:hypothetical protein T492DRAFT_958538 [Pavlovales sp. CCMP2436]|mmetsp:Transcript_44881/g.105084  ORF Transcript_44881/g.105084 Transcript_44881/m.105084 type:complete len:125 (+) Transcript_44881:1212-1586(+)
MASEDYDYFSAILGEGARTDYGNFFLGPYLQSGHLVLTPTVFLAAYVSDPNFPLTSLPVEYRDFVKVAIAITYAINAGIAVYAALIAAPARGLPAPFWAIKCFLLGGVALGELTSVPLKTEKKK